MTYDPFTGDFFDNVREGGHLPEGKDFDDLADDLALCPKCNHALSDDELTEETCYTCESREHMMELNSIYYEQTGLNRIARESRRG